MKAKHLDKVQPDVEHTLNALFDGARIMVGGFGLCGNAEALIQAVPDMRVKNLTLISNNAGNLGKGLSTWLKAGIVKEVICTYVGNNDELHRQMASKKVQVNISPQGTFGERMRAAGAGIPAFYTPTGIGTVIEEGKEKRSFEGRDYLLEHALFADFALIRAQQADTFGNLRFRRTARNFAPIMATAAKHSYVETDELLQLGELDPDDIHLPGIFVSRIVHVPAHDDPFEYLIERET
ncbi:MAG: CoA transferase subunit A [Myxococcales bacterium]|nr:MAG: CoA transferase subunit A [Myxococcales bacterium]